MGNSVSVRIPDRLFRWPNPNQPLEQLVERRVQVPGQPGMHSGHLKRQAPYRDDVPRPFSGCGLNGVAVGHSI